jgi:hypothetical protein
MTEPASQEPPPPHDDENEDALVPLLLTVFALYLAWRGANAGFRGSAATVRRVLSLDQIASGALAGVAQRAIADQRAASGRAGDELWTSTPDAVRDAVEVGLSTLADALLWTDSRTHGDPSTSDSGTAEPGEATVPTGEDPPSLLARLLATTVSNAAVLAAAGYAGWTRKTWRSRGDSRVREAHQILDGRTVGVNDAFEVLGHKLRFPGDPEAPFGLIVNCRCRLILSR